MTVGSILAHVKESTEKTRFDFYVLIHIKAKWSLIQNRERRGTGPSPWNKSSAYMKSSTQGYSGRVSGLWGVIFTDWQQSVQDSGVVFVWIETSWVKFKGFRGKGYKEMNALSWATCEALAWAMRSLTGTPVLTGSLRFLSLALHTYGYYYMYVYTTSWCRYYIYFKNSKFHIQSTTEF